MLALRVLAVLMLSWLAIPVARADALDDKLNRILADPAALAQAWGAGKSAAFFCFNCHGEAGISKLSDVPNLAGQNASYLLEQIRKFSTGKRRDEFMQGLMKVLTDDDRVNIAIFFSSLPVTPTTTRPSAAGGQLYGKLCVQCHGDKARGDHAIPRLAGQQVDYLVRSLTRYRNRSGERIDPLMMAMTAGLKDPDIKELAAYLASMR